MWRLLLYPGLRCAGLLVQPNFHRREEDAFFGAADAGWEGVLTIMLTDYCLLRSSEGELGEVEGSQIE